MTYLFTHKIHFAVMQPFGFTLEDHVAKKLISKAQGLQQDTEVEHEISCLTVGSSTFKLP
jgi:hypothetical protein